MVVFFFFTYVETADPHRKAVPSVPWGCPSTRVLPFALEVPSRPPTSRPKPHVPCPGTTLPCEGSSRGRQSYPLGQPAPFPRLPGGGICECQELRCTTQHPQCRRGGVQAGWALAPGSPGLALFGLAVSFSKDQNKTTKIQKNNNKNKKATKKF